MKRIPLTKGFGAIIDDEDLELVNKWKWCYAHGYAVRSGGYQSDGRKKRLIYMHRVIAGCMLYQKADHVNRNRLDNRRSNLRICTQAQNLANQGARPGNSSGYKGVSWDKLAGKWKAQICKNYKRKYLGNFVLLEDAVKAYNDAAKEHFGEFAHLNR